jgi:hypothetical protein
MPDQSPNRIAWTYTDNAGRQWRVAAKKAFTDQGVLGGSAAATTVPQRPAGFKMRRTTVSDNAGHSTVVPLYDDTQTLTTPGTTLDFYRFVGGVRQTFTGTSNGTIINEGSTRHNVTKQNA